jgi:DNA-binding transcriptional LysR family regulator
VTLFAPQISGTKVRLRSEITYDLIVAPIIPPPCKPELTLQGYSDYPLALPDQSFGARQAFDALFERRASSSRPVFVTSSLEMLKELVLSGAAATLLPALTVQPGNRGRPAPRRATAGKSAIRTRCRSLRRAGPPTFLRRGQAARFHRAFHAREGRWQPEAATPDMATD